MPAKKATGNGKKTLTAPTLISVLNIPEIKKGHIEVNITQDSPIVFHRWTQKAIIEILARQFKDSNINLRERRDPVREYFSAYYLTEEGYAAVPAVNIKQAIVAAARNIAGVTMAQLKQVLFIHGDKDGLIPLHYKGKPIKPSEKPQMDVDFENLSTFLENNKNSRDNVIGRDPAYPDNVLVYWAMVRVNNGGADVRFRPMIREWTAKVYIEFDADAVSSSQVVNLLNHAGFSSGLCENRPERSGGDNGRFKVV